MKTMKRILCMFLALAMLAGLFVTGVSAETKAGDTYAADPSAWGTQGNNGWYYLYRDVAGDYHEMNYYDSTAEIDWQKNNFASDPFTQGEMFFITQNTCFVGESGSRPTFAFKAPAGGQIELTTQTHSTGEMHMQVSVNNEVQKIGGEDSLQLCTTGTLPGGMTKTSLLLEVAKDDMVYVEFYSTDVGVQRQAWINEYSVSYISVAHDYTGETLAPDMSAWGTQGNNCWYWMYQDAAGNCKQMSYYDSSASIDWQKDAFASDPYTALEMYFINRDVFFLGEGGTRPVYAFKAPVGGEVELYFEYHGVSDFFAEVYIGDTLQKIDGNDRVTFTTEGTLEGGFTAAKMRLSVKKNSMIYIIPGNTDTALANRQGWLRNYSVKYLSTNNEVDYTSVAYAPDPAAWGTQGNNGWYYMYQDPIGSYGMLDWYDNTSPINWQQNNYAFDPYAMGEMLFIDPTHFFVGELGSKPVYAFKAPVSGEVKISFEIHGLESMGISAYVDDQLVQIEGKDRYTFCTTGPLAGAHTAVSFTAKVTKGQMIYIVCSDTGSNRDGWFRNPSAKYLSVSEDVDYTKVTLTPDMEKWGTSSNNCWSYLWKSAAGAYSPLSYYPADETDIDWQKDTYSFDPNTMGEMLFISKSIFFVGENGSRPVYAFTAPSGGTVQFTFRTHGVSAMHLDVFKNSEQVKVNGEDCIRFTTAGTLPGAYTDNVFTLDVKKGTTVYFVGGSDDIAADRGGYVSYYAAKYLSVNDEEEEPVIVVPPKVEGSAAEWNASTDYYAALQEKLRSDEPMTWVFVGDSITANDGDVTKGYRCYAEIFDSYLKSTLGRVNDRVVNTAVSGWKVRNIDYERDIAAYKPDVVYIKVGTNDNFTTDFAANSFYAAMSALYDKIIAGGAIPVIACANGFSSDWGNTEQTAAFAARYPDTIRTLAYAKNLLLVDYFSVYAENQAYSDSHYFNPDTIHPNRNGMLVHAQTLIRDLGMAQDSAILSQNAGNLSGCENAQLILPGLDTSDYITDGSDIKLADIDLNKTFVLAGGGNAVGASSELITFRSLGQYLNNNHQLGRCITVFADDDAVIPEGYSAAILMPEADTLCAGATAAEMQEKIASLADGIPVVLITPPPAAEEDDGVTAALAEETRKLADLLGCPLIDLYAYLEDCFELEPAAKTLWYGKDGLLNYAGCNDAILLIGTAFGLDAVKLSDNRYMENLTPETWGTQGANGFNYLYQNKATGEYAELPFVAKEEADAVWTANRYSLAANDFTFIGKDVLHAGAQYNPVKAFTVPYSGKVVVTLKHRRGVEDVTEGGTNGTMWIKAYLNDEQKTFDDGDEKIRLLADFGCYNEDRLTLDVEEGDIIYVVVDAEMPGQADLIETVTYLAAAGPEVCVHEYAADEEASSAATCTEDGATVYVCSKCGDSYFETIPALGHDLITDEAKEPTCLDAGLTEGSHCSRCDYKVAQEEIAALGHDYVDGICTRCGAEDPNYVKPDPCEGYIDIKRSAWYHSAVDFVIEAGIMGSTSTEELTFEPNTKVSRAMVASIMYRVAGSPEGVTYKGTFTDVKAGKWYTVAIEWAAQNGLVAGRGDGTYDPNGNVTRQELAVFMYKLAEYLGKDVSGADDLSRFSDAAKVPSWARTYVRWAVSAGLISGKGQTDGTVLLAPLDNATRAEFASVFMRFLTAD